MQALGKWEENDCEFETSLGYRARAQADEVCGQITMKPLDQQLSWTGDGGVYTVAWTVHLHFLP